MSNYGRPYPKEIAQMKRIKVKYGLSNSEIHERCTEYCKNRPHLVSPSARTVDSVFAEGSEEKSFAYRTIQPIVAVLSDMDKEQNEYSGDLAQLNFEQAELLRMIVAEKNSRIEELEAEVLDLTERKDYLKAEHDRAMRIIEQLTKR